MTQTHSLSRFTRHRTALYRLCRIIVLLALAATLFAALALPEGFKSHDLYKFRSVGEVALSPNGRYIAYTVIMNDQIDRSIAWYEKHCPPPGAAVKTNVQP